MIFLEMFIVFFMIGLFTIGGGYAMLPMIVEQVVGNKWMSLETVNNFIAIAEATPGPFAVNTANLVGFNRGMLNGLFGSGLAGALFGAVFTTLGVVLPSFLIILLIARYFHNFINVKWVKDALKGIKAIVVGLILAVVVDLIKTNVFGATDESSFDLYALIIIAIIFGTTLVYKKVSPILLIVISGVLGILFYTVLPLI